MPIAKLKASNTAEVMKADEGNDSIDTFIRQAIGKEPFISFSRAGDSPVQWIQLLHALDQQDGWPLLTPLKVQMQKCEKCSQEFCSSINYRRHIRVYHRLRKLDKDSNRNRELLGAFWNKLSEDQAKEILSFKDLELQEVSGSLIVKSLMTLVQKPGFSVLPQHCLRAGSALLEIVQSRPFKFPLTSEELFSILDDASEKTFLSGAAVSVQKFIFDGEAGKIGLETKNLVAFTSFLVEQKLVEAWLADKDAEALRCQKLLMEEEEAARRRQAELMEKKRQKKLRQKEQKAKEQRQGKEDVKDRIDETHNNVPPAEQPCTLIESDSDAHGPETSSAYKSSLKSLEVANLDGGLGIEVHQENGDADVGTGHVERRVFQVNNRKRVVARWQMAAKSQSNHLPNGSHSNQSHQAPKVNNPLKHGSQWELKPVPTANNRRWSRKAKAEYGEESWETEVQKESVSQRDNKKCEVLIGSISVALGNTKHRASNDLDCANDHSSTEHQTLQDVLPERRDVVNPAQSGATRSTVKLWRPVSRNGKTPMPVENGIRECHADDLATNAEDQNPFSGHGVESCYVDGSYCGAGTMDESLHSENLQFSSQEAKAFLAERWKEAIATEHVTLVLKPISEPSEYLEENGCVVSAAKFSDLKVHVVLGNAENHLVDMTHGSANPSASKTKFKAMPDKGVKLKYIPKQKTTTY